MRALRLFAALVALAGPLVARATDAPHAASVIQNSTGCEDCHMLHFAVGPTLTKQADNFTVCTSCHNNLAASFTFGGKWYSSDQGTPGAGGHSHHWNTSTTNATYGATPPTSSALSSYTPGNVLQCSTCHDPHPASAANAPANVHVSVATGTALAQSGGATSGATMTLAVGATPVPNGYRIQIGPAANQFQVSHNARYQSTTSVTWTSTYTITAANTAIPLSAAGDDPALSVTFSTMPTATGGYWDFYVSYPFLRMAAGEGELCVSCHAARNQTHTDVESSTTYGWGSGKPFSHPVGEAPNANGGGYDLSTPLDVNGAVQGAAGKDANATNDLLLSPTGKVTCVSCHAAHNADSNSQTVDAR
ncbi:cytochrome c3 family protein [Anaeromyxobacter oryzisoli]|uniref:cytochrome c3 family protein n=1 Tax=Anaeromyxobacter oryzisoli TaxID=2925408 RepID=UPI001F599753|nr:cytochrome c3 family protein [Anaeromyxobacter sp. SG63]